MVSSRLEAVRWQLRFNKLHQRSRLSDDDAGGLFGEVDDKESGPEPFKETSKELNPLLKGRAFREAFKGPNIRILLVANKFQTGFDQPCCVAMYNRQTTWTVFRPCRRCLD